MKSMLRYGLLGFGVYIIFLVALMPAEFVLKHIPMPNTVQLSGVQGSIWKGRVAKAQIYDQAFDNLTWNVSLLNVLLLTPKVNIDTLKNDNVQAKGNVGYSVWSSAIYADNITAKIDAAWLKRNYPSSSSWWQGHYDLKEISGIMGATCKVICFGTMHPSISSRVPELATPNTLIIKTIK